MLSLNDHFPLKSNDANILIFAGGSKISFIHFNSLLP
jgi:hypothetical protein